METIYLSFSFFLGIEFQTGQTNYLGSGGPNLSPAVAQSTLKDQFITGLKDEFSHQHILCHIIYQCNFGM